MTEPTDGWTLQTLLLHITALMDRDRDTAVKALDTANQQIEAARQSVSDASEKLGAVTEKQFDAIKSEIRIITKHQLTKTVQIAEILTWVAAVDGKGKGVGLSAAFVAQIISSLASIAAIVGLVVILARGH